MYKKPEQEDPQLAYARANHELLKKIEAHLALLMQVGIYKHHYDATEGTETREQ